MELLKKISSSSSNRLIILEGPDGAGKTTLASKLAKQLNFKLYHFSSDEDLDSVSLKNKYTQKLNNLNSNFIFDRSWFSETPYGTIHRNLSRLDSSAIARLESLCIPFDPIVVVCLPSLTQILHNFKTRFNQEYLNCETELIDIYDWYSKFTTSLPSLVYNFEIETFANLCLNLKALNNVYYHEGPPC